uniref:Head tail adaptor n=1 Tax=Myoviridae sp. ctCL221 TaxID=2826630 RepID=A0A8S5M6B1_9CAUD|nr:MAG TPA: Putative head tail adaptor [Myoviridae sp. ctCL221]
MTNAGDFNKKISIYQIEEMEDNDGFVAKNEIIILEPFSKVKTTKGYTLIASGSDFEKAYTNFTIRYSKKVEDAYYNSNRDVYVKYKNKIYTVEYLNNVDEANIELEMQCKRVTK